MPFLSLDSANTESIGTTLTMTGTGTAFEVDTGNGTGIAGTTETGTAVVGAARRGAGVDGEVDDGIGVYGSASGQESVGARGDAPNGIGAMGTGAFGVYGRSSSIGPAVAGRSTGYVGVAGLSESSAGDITAVGTFGLSKSSAGIWGGTRAAGVAGVVGDDGGIPGAFAGAFQGDVSVSGNVHAATAGFAGWVAILGGLSVVGLKLAAVPLPDGSYRVCIP